MKVGLITHHWVPNFGANLQVLATVSLLKSFGHDVKVIDYRPTKLVEKSNRKVQPEQIQIHEEFVQSFLPLTKSCANLKEVSYVNSVEKFDLLISGSDAVFKLDYNKNREDTTFPNPFWLSFAEKGQRKLFFSVSSMGTNFSTLDKKVKEGISETLVNSNINVRDKWTKAGLLKINPKLNIEQTVDPVFCLNKYFKIPEEFEFSSNDKYFVFNIYKDMVSDSWIERFVNLANQKGYKVFLLPNPQGNLFGKQILDEVIDLPVHPLTWYSIIQKSSGYFGVRFHPTVTSISNNIPFIALDNYQKGYLNRFTSKTFDICYKTNNTKYCLDKIRRRFLSPEKAIRWLTESKSENNFINEEIKKIESILNNELNGDRK